MVSFHSNDLDEARSMVSRHFYVNFIDMLQEGFQRHIGMSPMAYLREVRLGRVHEELRDTAPGAAAVSEIAYRWGFVHLGRFAAMYRQRYGVNPSQTLRPHSS